MTTIMRIITITMTTVITTIIEHDRLTPVIAKRRRKKTRQWRVSTNQALMLSAC
ncbi:hypothetical protein [Paraburkholderia piptadeniae]|uniref:hypothetical protein n=1 Tax=Paraburkholderia piptadeniae TaxID=1701573 RepID=UPI00139674DD|nr:hypothetical protein [Paraburkholderia piptadeniae]